MTAKERELYLIKGCKENSHTAQKEIYEQYGGLFFSICMRYAPNEPEAEQLLQDAFLKIFQSIKNYENKGSFEGWMKRIVVNTCLDHFKSRHFLFNKQTSYFDTVIEFDNMISVNDGVDNLTVKEILTYVQGLPDTTRSVFNLFIFEGYSHKEISAIVGVSEGTSQWHVNYARKLLKAKFENIFNQEKKKKHETSKVG